MRFTKMQSFGNDYVYIQLFEQIMSDRSLWARFISDRHYGIGSDGMILLEPSDNADFMMRVFNPDGSEAEMCGNALRSAAMLFFESGMTHKTALTVETLSGNKTVFLDIKNGHVHNITACIGKPDIISYGQLAADDVHFDYVYINVGNPHCVVFCEDPGKINIEKYGPIIEHHPLFKHKANVEFCEVIDKNTIALRTWERSCGETLCCATGSACAAVAAVHNENVFKKVTVHNIGGSIAVEWNDDGLYIKGRSNIVFTGVINTAPSEER